MPKSSRPITFIVPGHAESVARGAIAGVTRGAAGPALPAGFARGQLKHSVRVGAQRGRGGEVRVSAIPGEDVVVLHIAGGPTLTLHPATARDLMLAQQGEIKRSRGAAGRGALAPSEVAVPAQLQWRGLEAGAPTRGAARGFLGDVLLSAIEVITGVAQDPAADFVASAVVKRVDAQVDAGVYALSAESLPRLKGSGAALARVPAAPDSEPLLVFLHGTFSETSGTFGKLWTQHPQRVRALFKHYGDRVYGLDHPTLGVSPITNALALAQALPQGARLHLVTHSRGGLVGEVLARVCASPTLSAEDLGFFKGTEYQRQREDLRALAALVARRKIRVDRVVRVACPARGTLLASGRLDAYVSVFRWTLELAAIPVAPVLLDFLGEVAQRRADPAVLPGLAAQMPDSPLIQWLHAVDDAIGGDLRVVAGDIEGDSVTSWLKTLLADAFYWTDNDLVVQTRSMYGGAPRAAGASFLFDQGGKVTHFNYFGNERTSEAIVNALVQDAPQGFHVIGPLSWAGESATGLRAARRADDGKPAADKPAVFLLPGILGSNLKVEGKRIWLGWRLINGLKRLDYQPGRPDGVEPDGPIGMFYDDLAAFLAKTHEVIEFAYDWRRPIEEEARRLASAVDAALAARDASGQPVRIVAHSMGGVVARTMQLERPAVWQRMMAHPRARMLMLGTPNGGSWAPMQVLSGDDTFGNTLAALGAPFQDHAARSLMARFPGFIQLQAALLDAERGLHDAKTWQALADEDLTRVRENSWWHADERQLSAYRWGVPPQAVLDRAVALRKRLDAQRDAGLGNAKDQLALVVGRARFTPDGYEIGAHGLVYLDSPDDGDGRVPLSSALLPGVRTWQLDCEHGSLPDKKSAFEAYLQLLEQGTTNLLRPLAAAAVARGAAAAVSAHVRSRPSRARAAVRPPETEREVLAATPREPQAAAAAVPGTALRITVINGDLMFVREPLLLGHYRSLRLTGTERVVNRLVGGAMEDSLKAGLYPVPPGTHQVFVNSRGDPENPWQLPRPEAVIVCGLGEEGKLRASDLVHTVCQATIAWAQRMAERAAGAPAHFEIAATLIGSGGTGISVAQSTQLVAQGVREANEHVAACDWPRVSHLHLIELYLDRAAEAWRALQVQATAMPQYYTLTDTIQPGVGALRRPLDSGYRGAEYDFVTAVTQKGQHGDALIAYTLDTKRARTEVRAQATQGPLLRELMATASNDQNSDTQIGRTLFQLLVPVEMEPFLGGTTEMLIELDSGTAGIPWELLDTDARGGGDPRPWAIRAKLLRKLRTPEFRTQVADASADAHVLVIGEPQCDPVCYPRLPGARDEANAVAKRLTSAGALDADKVKSLISPEDPSQSGPDARTVINALLERDWRIVHIAGHGEPPEKIGPVPKRRDDPPQQDGDPRGVVLSSNTFLGPREICNMRVVPELVFVNCCYLAARNEGQLLAPAERAGYDRAHFASGVAEELIKIGVRCVIAAGWAVEDGPAMTFATTFYDALLRGHRFIDAVAQARETAHALGGNTWAAYQCYGDPDWFFRREGADAQRPRAPLAEEFGSVAAPTALTLALETLAVRSKFQGAPANDQRARIRHLEARFAPRWGRIGAVAEAFGGAWAAAGDRGKAVAWYEAALAANDGSASIRAIEQLGNLRLRLAWESVDAARVRRDDLKRSVASRQAPRGAGKARARGTRNADLAAAEQALRSAARKARKPITEAVVLLSKLAGVQPSMERESLLGSAYKRLAMIEAATGRSEARAIASMKAHYERAEALGRAGQSTEIYYPALNRIAAELVLEAGRRGWKGLDSSSVDAVRQSLACKARDDPDFWSVVGLTELRLYEALARGRLAAERAALESEYQDLRGRVSAVGLWASVYDQACFVLPKYAARAAAAEQKAAQALLALLDSLAGGADAAHPARRSGRK